MHQSTRENTKERKAYLEKRSLIHCGFCPYNRLENEKRKPWKSWKHRSKFKKQWEGNNSRKNYPDYYTKWIFTWYPDNYL